MKYNWWVKQAWCWAFVCLVVSDLDKKKSSCVTYTCIDIYVFAGLRLFSCFICPPNGNIILLRLSDSQILPEEWCFGDRLQSFLCYVSCPKVYLSWAQITTHLWVLLLCIGLSSKWLLWMIDFLYKSLSCVTVCYLFLYYCTIINDNSQIFFMVRVTLYYILQSDIDMNLP